MHAKMIGIGSSLPESIMTNDDIAQKVETSDAWIQERTGIATRHISTEETVSSMAADAAKKALEDAGISADELDLIIVSTCSPEQLLPCMACQVQKEIGAKRAICFDVNSACAGFITAYQVAAAQMGTGMIKTALLIGAENLSNIIDWTDRSTCILFGDGAGAAVVQATDDGPLDLTAVLHADGFIGSVLACNTGNSKLEEWKHPYVTMDGQAIYRFAVKQVPKVIREILKEKAMDVDEIDYFILHQANQRIIESIAKHMKQPIEKFPMNLQETGNMSSATIPVLMDRMKKEGKLTPGTKTVIAGFGAGLTWGGFYMEW